jgi:hypothetical protein
MCLGSAYRVYIVKEVASIPVSWTAKGLEISLGLAVILLAIFALEWVPKCRLG